MNTKLYRSRTNTMIGGVCGGLGRYLNLDPVLVRLVFVVLALANGVGVLIYLVLWFITPVEDQAETATLEDTARTSAGEMADRARLMGEDLRRAMTTPNPQAGMIIGAVLIALGLIFLLRNISPEWMWWLDFDVLWPLVLVAIGAVLLLRRAKGE